VDYKFGQFTPDHLHRMKEGVELFNQQMYWECHEALEDVWMEDRNDSARNVYWAVIQVAAACIHYRDNNVIGARGMIYKAKEKFKRCRDLHVVTDVVLENLDWQELENLVFAITDKDAAIEEFALLYDFRFKKYSY
jgi:predicted metal-dependent hydrolase